MKSIPLFSVIMGGLISPPDSGLRASALSLATGSWMSLRAISAPNQPPNRWQARFKKIHADVLVSKQKVV